MMSLSREFVGAFLFAPNKLLSCVTRPDSLDKNLDGERTAAAFWLAMPKKNWRPDVYELAQRYDEEAWAALRLRVIKRDRYKCYRCGKRSKTTVGLSAHHIIPRKERGPDTLDNLITLCHPCHDYVELMEFRSLKEILDSNDDSPIVDGVREPAKHINKHDWHLWVYGGYKQPRRRRRAKPSASAATGETSVS